jgi:hypothetical protein
MIASMLPCALVCDAFKFGLPGSRDTFKTECEANALCLATLCVAYTSYFGQGFRIPVKNKKSLPPDAQTKTKDQNNGFDFSSFASAGY